MTLVAQVPLKAQQLPGSGQLPMAQGPLAALQEAEMEPRWAQTPDQACVWRPMLSQQHVTHEIMLYWVQGHCLPSRCAFQNIRRLSKAGKALGSGGLPGPGGRPSQPALGPPPGPLPAGQDSPAQQAHVCAVRMGSEIRMHGDCSHRFQDWEHRGNPSQVPEMQCLR